MHVDVERELLRCQDGQQDLILPATLVILQDGQQDLFLPATLVTRSQDLTARKGRRERVGPAMMANATARTSPNSWQK